MNIDTAKSFATRQNLEKALAKAEILSHPHLTVRNTEGRWTAVFPHSNFQRKDCFPDGMCYVAFYASLGYMQLG